MNSFYTLEELRNIGFCSIGRSVFISKKASFYSVENIIIGSDVRIDDFCILSGTIRIGSHVHISAYCGLYGANGIELEDYTGLSPRCTVFSATDDFSGNFLIGPMVNENFTNVTGGKVILHKYSQVGASSIIMPGAILNEGVAVGAMSLVKGSLNEWSIYAGVPAKKINDRSRNLMNFINAGLL